MTPLDGSGIDLLCSPADIGFRLDGADIAVAMVSLLRPGGDRNEMRGARAPPSYFA